ncbi:MAG: ATP synthase F1 subunit delta [Deferribacteres bacterium]|nr:ATP synthase F1 subunit delta [candidate division KSB1 bacterium]MCB9511745.1 ATP synthase F1 subunit delta [Deferribacteres bacterium]
MKATVLAHRYAKALFELAVEKNNLDTIAKEVAIFEQVLQQNTKLKYYFHSPEAGKAGKRALIEKNFQDRFSALFIHFVFILLDKGRQNIFSEIAAEFKRISDKHNNKVRASTITAVPLPQNQLELLKKNLGEQYKATFEIENYVDPDILGGMVLNIEGKVIDASLRNQLEKMKAAMFASRN